MRSVIIPGYEEIFGKPNLSYDEILKDISSDVIMMMIVGLNAELNTDEKHSDRQERLLSAITLQYSSKQLFDLKAGLEKFKSKDTSYDGTLFGRRYLLSMFMRELKRDNKVNLIQTDPIHAYNFLIAYLITIDDVNSQDHLLMENAKKNTLSIMPTFPLIWASTINQYEFNEMCNPAFEFFKLLSFCKYSYDKYKSHLKELVNLNGFINISQYLASFNQIQSAAQVNQENELLKRLYFIAPKDESSINYLRTKSINNYSKKFNVSVSDLKKNPLYETEKRGFMVIDEDMYKKKIYRGPLFDLLKRTSLKNEISFEDYKNDVSKECFDSVLFKGIVKGLTKTNQDRLHFDTNSNIGEPDLYYRVGKDVFLVEFKDYLFPDAIISGLEFENYLNYINERLVNSDKNKSKGVGQLVNNIASLFSSKYSFDPELNGMIQIGEEINIHPIICHTDFMFSMPGLNEYLNCVFQRKLSEKGLTKIGINRITVINFEVLFDMFLRGGNFTELLEFIKRYYYGISINRQKAIELSSSEYFIESTASFDEIYQIVFRNEMIDNGKLTNKTNTNKLKDIIGITQKQIDEIL